MLTESFLSSPSTEKHNYLFNKNLDNTIYGLYESCLLPITFVYITHDSKNTCNVTLWSARLTLYRLSADRFI